MLVIKVPSILVNSIKIKNIKIYLDEKSLQFKFYLEDFQKILYFHKLNKGCILHNVKFYLFIIKGVTMRAIFSNPAG